VHEQDGDLLPLEIADFLTPRALVTVRKDPRIALGPLLERWDVLRALAPSGVGYLAHGLVDVLVDGYVVVAQDLDDTSDKLEDELFTEDVGTADLQKRTLQARSEVTSMRRIVLPMRDVVATMRRPDVELSDDHLEPYLRDVDDHVSRVLDSLETTREQLATALDTTIAMQGQRLNETVFRLTAWAAVLAVTTAITGYFGQNIPYPGIEQESGFWASTVLLVVSTVGLYAYFKRKGWL
jgi:magnesium transporter